LSKARDQANTVACKSNLKQFFNLWAMYGVDNHDYALPCYYLLSQPPNTYINWWEWSLLGTEALRALPRSDSTNTTATAMGANTTEMYADQLCIKLVLRCPAADHSSDPGIGSPYYQNNTYYGDYVYNYWMGITKSTADNQNHTFNGGNGSNAPIQKVSTIPGNVLLMIESTKPNAVLSGSSFTSAAAHYESYFQDWMWLVDAGAHGNGPNVNRIGTPHVSNTMCNCLSADGHISLINPYTASLEAGTCAATGLPNLQGQTYPFTFTNPTFKSYLIAPPPGDTYDEPPNGFTGTAGDGTPNYKPWDKSYAGL
jgi:hypothetical protein